MINRVVLVGRLARDPELRQTSNATDPISFCYFTVVCDRYMGRDKESRADFIDCICWRQIADFICRYGKKGFIVAIDGSVETYTTEVDGQKRTTTRVLADQVRILEKKSTETGDPTPPESKSSTPSYKFSDDDLPF
ncbi:Single-stranded DNA-binding protein A [termite gut metagenome]|uniref:Single-stranded DNA-binding protein A n=1 Tax=termite gut metagenome TaxID=433724 RepID=A0A5J4PFI5_9ZZZZ